MEKKKNNKKIAIYIAVLIALLGGSFIIYKIASASIDNAVIASVEMTEIKTGENLDSEDGLTTTCDGQGQNCTSTYTGGKDSNSNNVIVKSFDKIKYTFGIVVADGTNPENGVDDVKVNLKVTLNGDDSKYVSINSPECNSEGLCSIEHVSSYDNIHYYTLELNVNNAPNVHAIQPSFEFDVEENNNDTPIKLGYNTASPNSYYYSYDNGTYSAEGPNGNYMPTLVSATSPSATDTAVLLGENSYTQAANYDGTDGRFITYLLGIKLNATALSGTYYENNEITFNVSFSNGNGAGTPIAKESWIRFYGTSVDGINNVSGALPYSSNGATEYSKFITKPGTITVTKDGNNYVVRITDFKLLLNSPTLNANNTPADGYYIATIALTNFSPRLDADGQNAINNTITVTKGSQTLTKTIQNAPETLGTATGSNSQTTDDVTTKSAWYTEDEESLISSNGTGAVSKGTAVKYKTVFKNNKTSANTGLKEVLKFDIDAFRVLPYNDSDDISIKVKCGKDECADISKNDFEVKFVSGSFDSANYTLANVANSKLSDSDKAIANACASIDLSVLNKDQIQNLYGGPCITASESEAVFDKINDASSINGDTEVEIPISKVIVQTKEGVVIPDGAEVIITAKVRVRDVSDLSRTYQATTMISTSDYDEKLHYFAPQINNAISPNSYDKTYYNGNVAITSNGSIGDTLKIVNFALRQDVSVTNKDSSGSLITRYRTSNNETITYKVSTSLIDNNMNVGADDTWYIKEVRVFVNIPNKLIYIPDDDLIAPVSVVTDSTGTRLEYLLITSSDKIKSNMKINDIYFKTKLNPTLSGSGVDIVVTSEPFGININGEVDTSICKGGSFTIKGTGVQEVIGTQSIGDSGSLIEKNGTINYVLNAYNNVGENVSDYTIVDILPYNGDENGSNYKGNYKVKISSSEVSLSGIKCTTTAPSKINIENSQIWEDCADITSEAKEDITAIRLDNISIAAGEYMGNIIVSLVTKDNEPADKYNNRFKGFVSSSAINESNIIEASVINRTISGYAFLDNTCNSVKDGSEAYISGIPVSLYKVTNNSELKKVADTETDENGYYVFNNLEKGRYKIRAKYDITKYDLALRYATEDINKDSDAYLIDEDGTIEISDKTETSQGLVLNATVNNITNMDIGLLPKHTFGFIMNKYITRIDLTNNGILSTNTYDNLSTVSLSVINPNKYTAKVYYGISITNNSNKAGYINLVKEDIPKGFVFDKSYPENAGWFDMDGQLGNRSLENVVVSPNETVYLQIVLFLPARDEAGTFVNTASVVETTEYDGVKRSAEDAAYVGSDDYEIGDYVRYAGVDFHVIGTTPNGNEQILTLLADAGQVSKQSHGTGVYKWSTSNINNYLNNNWIAEHNINTSALIPFNICDDASGLFDASANGGVVDAATCTSNIYTTSYVRLLTNAEFGVLNNNISDQSFLTNGGNFWLMDAVYPSVSANDNIYNEYGAVKDEYNTSSKAKYVDVSNLSVKTSGISSSNAVRPVIRISTHNIILE